MYPVAGFRNGLQHGLRKHLPDQIQVGVGHVIRLTTADE
ncbi:MAG: hypothetical protein BWX84_02420 [Verrucomicrobia bacterium ADurb.Bin118]|nr:MAG: hypothetical protein BWX84_02420 [Verrucomicrobia bacterium ADurb.Bin118]